MVPIPVLYWGVWNCWFLLPHTWFLCFLSGSLESLLFITSVVKFHRGGSCGSGFTHCAGHTGSPFSLVIHVLEDAENFISYFFSFWHFCFSDVFVRISISFIEILLFAYYTLLNQTSNSYLFSCSLCHFAPLWKIFSTLSSTHSTEFFMSTIVFLICKNYLFFWTLLYVNMQKKILFPFDESTIYLKTLRTFFLSWNFFLCLPS